MTVPARIENLPVRTICQAESFLFTKQMRCIELPPYIKEIEQYGFLVGRGIFAEKVFDIYAFPNTVGYSYAVENQIPVHPSGAIVY